MDARDVVTLLQAFQSGGLAGGHHHGEARAACAHPCQTAPCPPKHDETPKLNEEIENAIATIIHAFGEGFIRPILYGVDPTTGLQPPTLANETALRSLPHVALGQRYVLLDIGRGGKALVAIEAVTPQNKVSSIRVLDIDAPGARADFIL